MSIEASFPTIKPTLNLDFANTKELDPRITFTRASTATYYNGETSALAEQNLLTYSQAIGGTNWVQSSATPTLNNAVAPDGTTTATLLTLTAANAPHYTFQTATVALSTSITHSIYAKAGTQNYIQIAAGSEGSFYANFDLSLGVVGTSAGIISTSIVSVGNGWYRCIATLTSSVTATSLVATLVPAANSTRIPTWTAVGTETVYLWGAQLEQRSAVTAYTPTTTAAITNYIPVLLTAQAGQARFDHNPNTGESLGLEIEEQRTNLVTYSGAVGGTNWTPLNIISTLNTAIAPDGTLTASNIIANTVNSAHYLQQLGPSLTAGTYTASCYIKAYTARYIIMGLLFDNNANRYVVIFDALNGVVVGTTGVQGTTTNGSSTISPVGNGWYKVSVTATTPTMTSGPFIRILNPSNNSTYNETNPFAGDGYSGVLVWGAQIEAGSFATSYIPTVASQVTRSADAASLTGTNFSSWYRADEGTLYANGIRNSNDLSAYPRFAHLTLDGFEIYSIGIGQWTANTTTGLVFNNTVQANITTTVSGATFGTNIKAAIAFKTNDISATANGVSALTDTSATIPEIRRLYIGSNGTSMPLGGTIKKIAYYPLRLTNAQLQALTS